MTRKWSERPRIPCASCGARTGYPRGSKLAPSSPLCRDCRKVRQNPKLACVDCGRSRSRSTPGRPCLRCRSCDNARRRAAFRGGGVRLRRAKIDELAPGLRVAARKRLLQRWLRRGCPCFWCGGTPDTVDHLIPLIRGGTNGEGNLVPACRRCNSSKAHRLPIEMRLGLPASTTWTHRDWLTTPPPRVAPRRRRVAAKQMEILICSVCSKMFEGTHNSQRYCSRECAAEHNAQAVRERYRASVGLPSTWGKPVRRRAA